MKRFIIIQLNIADLAAAVECLIDRLRGRPVIMAPESAVRATVYDMNEEAYLNGVRKQMPLKRNKGRQPFELPTCLAHLP